MAVDYSNDLILVTCASGKQAQHVIPHLQTDWKRLRLQAHSEGSVKRLKDTYPSAEVVQADMNNTDHAAKLVEGVSAVWYVGPSFHPHETQIGYTMVDAAVAESKKPGSKFQHFVFSSVLQTQLRKLLNHDCKRYVEEYLMESGLQFTILQPSHFLNNFPLPMLAQQEEPVFKAPYNLNAFSFTILEDYGAAAAKVFKEREKHYYAQYPLVSTFPVSYEDIVVEAGVAIGKQVKVEKLPFEIAVETFTKRITGSDNPDPRSTDAAERMLLYYNRRGLLGSPTLMEWLLERKATTPAQWMKSTMEKTRK